MQPADHPRRTLARSAMHKLLLLGCAGVACGCLALNTASAEWGPHDHDHEHDRDRGHEHEHEHFRDHDRGRWHEDHGRDWHRYGYGGGYYAPPPVVYSQPYYAPPPVVYGPGIGLNIHIP